MTDKWMSNKWLLVIVQVCEKSKIYLEIDYYCKFSVTVDQMEIYKCSSHDINKPVYSGDLALYSISVKIQWEDTPW